MELQEFFSRMKVTPKDVVAQALASWTFNNLSERVINPALESAFISNKIDDTSAVARKAIEMACHLASGVAHSTQWADGPVGGFSATVLGSVFSELAARLGRGTTTPIVVDVTPEWYRHPGAQQVLDTEVQELAIINLTKRFEESRSQPRKDKRGQRLANLLERIRQGVQAERKELTQTFDDANDWITTRRNKNRSRL